MSAFSRIVLNVNQDRNDDTRNVENFEDGDFPALRPNSHRRAHALHTVTGHYSSQNSVPYFLTRRIPTTQNNPLQQNFTQPQNMATDISPHNTLPVDKKTPQRQKSGSSNRNNRPDVAI